MKTRDLRSLSETIASVVDPIDKERAQMLQEGFLNSLTEKARQIASKEMEDEDEEEDEMEEKGEEEEEKPSSKKKSKMMKEEIELAEKAAPGYEDWASDPKVKASFKNQYGKRWKEVMYGHSWNLAKQEKKVGLDEETLDEAVSAKRMRIIRKYVKGNKRVPEHLKDYMERSFKKKRAKDAKLSDGRGAVGALETRMRRKSAALRARGIEPKGVAPGYLEEGYQAKRLRIFRKASKNEFAKFAPGTENFMKNSFKRKVTRDNTISGGKGSVRALDIRRRKKAAAMKAKGLPESEQLDELSKKTLGSYIKKAAADIDYERTDTNPENEERVEKKVRKRLRGISRATDALVKEDSEQLDEAGYKRLMRLKKAAYKAGQTGSPSHGRKMRAAAERESQVAAGMARRGGASPDAVRGGGSRIGKSGKYTQKAGALANQRDKALASFRSKVRTAELFGREQTDKGAKRERQQTQAKFANKARSGDFGQNNQEALRARSNFEKRYGRLKGK